MGGHFVHLLQVIHELRLACSDLLGKVRALLPAELGVSLQQLRVQYVPLGVVQVLVPTGEGTGAREGGREVRERKGGREGSERGREGGREVREEGREEEVGSVSSSGGPFRGRGCARE